MPRQSQEFPALTGLMFALANLAREHSITVQSRGQVGCCLLTIADPSLQSPKIMYSLYCTLLFSLFLCALLCLNIFFVSLSLSCVCVCVCVCVCYTLSSLSSLSSLSLSQCLWMSLLPHWCIFSQDRCEEGRCYYTGSIQSPFSIHVKLDRHE